MSGNIFKLDFTYNAKLFTLRGHGIVMRRINRQMGHRHAMRVVSKHFEDRPETKPGVGGYGFARRSKDWQQKKKLETGRNLPLVYKGDLRRKLLSRSGYKITATQSRWTYKARGTYPMTLQRRRELEVVTPREQRDEARLMNRLYVGAANSGVFAEHRRQRIRK